MDYSNEVALNWWHGQLDKVMSQSNSLYLYNSIYGGVEICAELAILPEQIKLTALGTVVADLGGDPGVERNPPFYQDVKNCLLSI